MAMLLYWEETETVLKAANVQPAQFEDKLGGTYLHTANGYFNEQVVTMQRIPGTRRHPEFRCVIFNLDTKEARIEVLSGERLLVVYR